MWTARGACLLPCMFEQFFKSAEPEFETAFMVGVNNWTFNAEGSFTGA